MAALLVVGTLATVVFVGGDDPEERSPSFDELVAVDEGSSLLWPYTSRRPSVEERTLAINVVVMADDDEVRRALTDRSGANWTNVSGDETVTESPWEAAHGAARYSYVVPPGEDTGRWIVASDQWSVGTYFGRRIHIRAYPGSDGNWTALQAHEEYWDWFRLRHTVTGVSPGARFVERDLRGEPFVTEISRVYHGNAGGGSDGWLTVVELASALAVGGAVGAVGVVGAAVPPVWRRLDPGDVVLPVALIWLVLGVRAAGIAAEQLVPFVTPKLFAATFYPFLAAGPPLLAARFAKGRRPTRTGVLAAAGFGAGLVLDLGSVGVTVVPVHVALHRTLLVATLGWLAYGFAADDDRVVAAGLLAWVGLLAGALVGVV